ncbi:hypothetical protein PGT21_023000 [Puccinia graminis f. sp. tritici]|uniref:Uncharacterized protein n=1 Tax=Puccinia graminis f. sp. tritici TaxID=56615 RepID=A0A5B0RE13_PUCGR|nr:hypothetical protein PGT21_023000 [Puccinia graminis f. sp. tritici]KAA1124046.1 hypothetical protein PGTUg99_023623 [Puccinia graminis f. sp. tritici]
MTKRNLNQATNTSEVVNLNPSMTKSNLNQATNSSELVSNLNPGNMIHWCSLSNLALTLTELSISSDSDDQPIALVKEQLSHEGTLLCQALNHQTTSKNPLKTLVYKESKQKSLWVSLLRRLNYSLKDFTNP